MDNKTRIEKESELQSKYKRLWEYNETNALIWGNGYKAGYTAAVKEIIKQVEAYPMLPKEKQSWLTYLKGLIEEPSEQASPPANTPPVS